LPLVVWVHGGGWIGGTRTQMREYLQIIAGAGYVAVGLDYSHAPRRHHPVQARQVNTALRYLTSLEDSYGIDPQRVVLAGDSAGAQIAAQVAAAHVDPSYARAIGLVPALRPGQIRAAVLMCGAYDLTGPLGRGVQARILHAALWAYAGIRNYRTDPAFGYASVLYHLTPDYPPAFVTAGDTDPVLPQSRELVERLDALGVATSPLFPDAGTGAGHEYHLDLDTEPAAHALTQLLAHLAERTSPLEGSTYDSAPVPTGLPVGRVDLGAPDGGQQHGE
jgi:acetyl esterase/lipase